MEHLREYQDYLLAYRLRAVIGGPARPRGAPLALAAYASRRLRRQALAREVATKADYHAALREVERLSDELNFGMWHDPIETNALLRQVVAVGGCPALESEAAFAEALLTPAELRRAGPAATGRLARYYLGLVRAAAAYLDAEVFDRVRGALDVERAHLPLVVGQASVAIDEA